MLSKEDNELITQTGPGTPGGEFLRRYWHPVALSEELPVGGAPVPLRILGEELVLFRDEFERPGLLDRFCAHRQADLSYGRIECGGLRCLYHGWVYDISGSCLEQPAAGPGSRYHERVQQNAYPCQEVAGMVFAYMGPDDPPLLPGYEFFDASDENRVVTKAYHRCNWLQGNEGSVDPVHTSFLHRVMGGEDADWMAVEGSEATHQELLDERVVPDIKVVETDYGLQVLTLREVGDDRVFVRVESVLFPNGGAYGGPAAAPEHRGYGVNWHVPIDDHSHWKFLFAFSKDRPLPKEEYFGAKDGEITESYMFVRSPENRFLQDRAAMADKTFSGIGYSFNVHDALMVETMGPIVDRSKEHLGVEDRAIVAYRRQIRKAIEAVQQGRDPLFVVRDPGSNRFEYLAGHRVIPKDADWRTEWKLEVPVAS